jgi:ferredoxin
VLYITPNGAIWSCTAVDAFLKEKLSYHIARKSSPSTVCNVYAAQLHCEAVSEVCGCCGEVCTAAPDWDAVLPTRYLFSHGAFLPTTRLSCRQIEILVDMRRWFECEMDLRVLAFISITIAYRWEVCIPLCPALFWARDFVVLNRVFWDNVVVC